jgi:hypothetical protein
MRVVRAYIQGGVCSAGGSVSRLQEEVYREAADLAYYFHWQRGEIMGMNMRERRTWLTQIKRIHYEQKRARDRELEEQAVYLRNMRGQEGAEE